MIFCVPLFSCRCLSSNKKKIGLNEEILPTIHFLRFFDDDVNVYKAVTTKQKKIGKGKFLNSTESKGPWTFFSLFAPFSFLLNGFTWQCTVSNYGFMLFVCRYYCQISVILFISTFYILLLFHYHSYIDCC